MFQLINIALMFAVGVMRIIAGWARELYEYELRFYRSLHRFIIRLIEVERRIRPHYKKVVFIYRFSHYALHRLHLQPRWLKISQAAMVIVIISLPTMLEYFEHRREVNHLYEFYYRHFHKQYYDRFRRRAGAENSNKADIKARHYASYYADYYANYFTSDAYRDALRYALPPPTGETTAISADEVPEAKNVSLTVTSDGVQLIKNHEGLVLRPYLTADAIGMIQEFEGFEERSYRDSGGKITIGYGHLLRKGEKLDSISRREAEKIFQQDIRVAENYVKRLVKVPLNPNQFSALVSLVYNIGPTQFKRSTLLRKLNDGDYTGAAEEFLRWKYVGKKPVKGLAKRRLAEKELFLSAWEAV